MELFYRKYGKGVPLIIVHGLYGASDNWISVGRSLSENFEVFIIDQRNHGRSPHSDSHNYQLMVADLLEFFEQHKIEKAILIGHSMGGKTVMHFSRKYPEKVIGLVVLDIAPKSYVKIAKENSTELSHYGILDAMKNIDFNSIKHREEVDKMLMTTIQSKRIRQFLLKNISRNEHKIFSWKINIDALYKDLDKILDGMDDDLYNYGDRITGFPVLFIKGANSDYITEADAERIESIFPYTEIKTIEDAGHWLHAEQPQKLISMIFEFFA